LHRIKTVLIFNLASGKFAMIDDGLGFSLVPWHPVLEKQLDRHVTGITMSGGGIDWTFGRSRGSGFQNCQSAHQAALIIAAACNVSGRRCV